ncbi:tetratricopeptide repeat protein [Geomonas nitrogeniifigens]|uniref:Tetratricopeptide repeat protein n=1 Tax=Geomonas diazotrophica TaxID=2843197 RepID=A0ABX8JIH2_9BACT|nr:tetratricopeptide repeat protein [Geomonas nitrogeniifigens]QWV96429.1 tetratricopeptide repeat protein [Geomonas nitrogeniifigens]
MTTCELRSSRTRLAIFLILVLAVCVAYGNTLSNGFVYDDEYQVLKNPWIRDFHFLPTIFTNEVWGFKGSSVSNYYRPLLHVVYMACYYLFGLKAWGYHALNILLHAAVTILVFLLCEAVLARENSRHVTAFSLLAAMLFAVHPIHTEVVAAVMCVTDLLLTLFYIGCVYLHVRYLDRSWYYKLLPAALFALALLSKEIAITLPLVLLVVDYLVEKRIAPLSRLVARYAPYLAVALCYLAVRGSVLGAFAPINRHPDLSPFQLILNTFPLAMRYAWKLIVPVELNAMYEFNPVRSLSEPLAVFSVLTVVAAVALLCGVARKTKTVAFGLVLAFVPLLPAFYIRAIPYPFAERYLYLPSVGAVLVLAGLLSKHIQSPRAVRAWCVALSLVGCCYLVATVRRNTVWKDNYTLWSDTVLKSPDNAIVHANLGAALKSMGRLSEAIAQITFATQLDASTEFFRQLGSAYYQAGDRQEAVRQYEKAVALEPANGMAHNDLGALYGELGAYAKAIEHLEAAIRLDPSHADSHYNLGMAYLDAGMKDKAAEQFEASVRLNPDEPEFRARLSATLNELKK